MLPCYSYRNIVPPLNVLYVDIMSCLQPQLQVFLACVCVRALWAGPPNTWLLHYIHLYSIKSSTCSMRTPTHLSFVARSRSSLVVLVSSNHLLVFADYFSPAPRIARTIHSSQRHTKPSAFSLQPSASLCHSTLYTLYHLPGLCHHQSAHPSKLQ